MSNAWKGGEPDDLAKGVKALGAAAKSSAAAYDELRRSLNSIRHLLPIPRKTTKRARARRQSRLRLRGF